MSTEIALAFVKQSKVQVEYAREKISHCFSQLKDEDIWWAPEKTCNSIGIILQHLMGNLRQWAISGIGGEPDVRNRPSEFRAERRLSKAELWAAFNDVLDRVIDAYSRVTDQGLLKPRKIQSFDTNVLDAMYDTMCHLQLHTGQILYLTHIRLGGKYELSWKPANKEQGA